MLTPRPNPMPLVTTLLSRCMRLPLFFAATAAFGSASLAVSPFDKQGRLQHHIAQNWARFSLGVSGATIEVVGAENLARQNVGVYASNHLSYMDTPAIFSSLPFQFRIVARSNLWKVPFIGWHLQRSGQIPVNVDNPRASISSLSGGVKTLREGMPLFIFPEGGRSKDAHPSTFLNGPAFMAIRAQVPLIPMALVGTHELLPIHTKDFFPVPLKLIVGEPLATAGRTLREVDAMTRELSEAILELYYRHSYLERPPQAGLETISEVVEPA